MHAFDIIFGAFVLIFVLLGVRRGFIDEVMRLAAIIIGFIGALALYRQFIPKLSFLSLSPHITIVVSFLIIFFCFALGTVFIGKILKKLVKLTMMGWLDRLCGACIGSIKAFFVGWIFVVIVSSIPIAGMHHFFKDSRVYSFFMAISPALKSQVLTHVPSQTRALARPSALQDFWKKLTVSERNPDSSSSKESPAKKNHSGSEKKR
jgi:membrane protein required for colicin V production